MYKPDNATTERNAKILRELVKQPSDKLCADCKRNDPRWASWNLGVYLCIRCLGIHRGMGTHISRVKSMDIDMWTPEQMEKWGNHRANLYWEAQIWLLSAAVARRVHVPSTPTQAQVPSQPRSCPNPNSNRHKTTSSHSNFKVFHTPASAPQAPAKDVKQDILSLFSAGTAQPANAVRGSPWVAQVQAQPPQAQQPISLMGTTGTGMWGVSSGWTGAPTSTVTSTTNVWGRSSTGANAFEIVNTNDIWGGSADQPAPASKKDDVFGDLWSDFK